MKTLDKVVSEYVDLRYTIGSTDGSVPLDDSTFSVEEIVSGVKNGIKERIVAEVLEDHKKEILKVTKNAIENERKKSSFIAIKELMWEAFVLSIFVGLLGNELTTLIEFFKSFGGEENHTLITVVLIGVFTIIVLLLYIVKFTQDIIDKLIIKKKTREE